MRINTYFSVLLTYVFCSVGTIYAGEKKPFIIEEEGRGTWRMTFDKKCPTSAEHWEYAHKTQNKGHLKKADRRMLYLVRRWPNSKEAPWAQRSRADMFYSRGKLKQAFNEYQSLIQNYSSRMRDYDSVLDAQFEIAVKIMNRKRMRWIFGGFKAPEHAVEYFENIIRNGPQWSRAPEAEFLIGQAYQGSGELELAIAAYAVLGYHYPNSSFAEESTWQQIQCLDKLREKYPNSLDILNRELRTTTVFQELYWASSRHSEVLLLRNELYEVMAKKAFDESAFYAKVPKKFEAAIIYYKMMIEAYPKSALMPEAEKRISKLNQLVMEAEGHSDSKKVTADTTEEIVLSVDEKTAIEAVPQKQKKETVTTKLHANAPKDPKLAIAYYEQVIKESTQSEVVSAAKKRQAELQLSMLVSALEETPLKKAEKGIR